MKNLLLFLFSSLLLQSAELKAQTARLQAIHNCPDPAAATVDVWLNNVLLLDDFNYKDATPYIDAPAGSDFDLSICASSSTDTTGAIFRKSFNLIPNETYVVVAGGGLAETGATAFDLRAYTGLEQGLNPGNGELSINVIHGSYDAPMVDVYEVQIPAGELLGDLSFGEDIGSYVNLPAADFDLQIRTQAGVAAAQFDANLTLLADQALIVLATGYLDPASAVGSEPFGLLAVLPDGTVLPLSMQMITPARLQVIHNCAATDAALVDVWLNDGPQPLLDDFAFRTASPFIDAPAGQFFDVSISLPGSIDTTGALFRQTFLLESSKTYIVIASGTIGSGMYTPAQPFSLEVIPEARETAQVSGNVDVIVWHGSTDAPAVDVVETQVGAGTIIDDIAYGTAQGYLGLPPANYDLEIRDASGTTTLFSYDADLRALANTAITVLASGFVDPSMNNNGAAFGLYAALPSGGNLIPLPAIITGINSIENFQELIAWPNPVSGKLTINTLTVSPDQYVYKIISYDGKIIQSDLLNLPAGNASTSLGVDELSSGFYYINISNSEGSIQIPFIKI